MGKRALRNNTSGVNNIALGASALFGNKSGKSNIAIGVSALRKNGIGGDNIAVGEGALYNNSNGSDNVAIGKYAGRYNDKDNNSSNTFIGSAADTVSNTVLSNATALGASAIVTASNTIQLGNAKVTHVITSGTISATEFRGNRAIFNKGGSKTNGSAGLFGKISGITEIELYAFDSVGNESVISPHHFSLIDAPSEDMAWSFYSKNKKKGKQVNVDMMKMVRSVERLSGQKLIYLADLEGNPIEEVSLTEATRMEQEIKKLKAQNRAYQKTLETLLKRLEALENISTK